jgi:hypothetical protein
MSKRQQRARIGVQKQTLPCLIFSFEQLTFLKRTLAALTQVIRRQTKPLRNLDFAAQTVEELQAKIETMLNAEMWGKVVEMDANELLMLQTSVWIFTAALDAIPDVKEKEQLRKQCQTVGLFLAPFSKQMFHKN